jgi:hypothetical protein
MVMAFEIANAVETHFHNPTYLLQATILKTFPSSTQSLSSQKPKSGYVKYHLNNFVFEVYLKTLLNFKSVIHLKFIIEL